MLKVTLKKSLIGNTPANRATVYALGLRKIGQSNTFEPTQSILGMIHKVKHLLVVEEVEGTKVRRRQGHQASAGTAEPKAAKKAAPKAAAKKATAKKSDSAAKTEESKPKRTTTRKKKTEE